jgi:enterochelin esterase-like enzyme
MSAKQVSGALIALIALIALPVMSADPSKQMPAANKGSIEHIKVHGKALVGNLEGDAPDRDVFVYLPPGYGKDKKKRYPVVYTLHGYTVSAQFWSNFLQWPARPNNAFTVGGLPEMILVMPDALTLHNGSMYSQSVTTGDWETYIVKDLVEYIDSHYRTIPNRMSRGLTGHSMGGYGTIRIGMKYPEVFSSFYAMSSCCMPPRTADGPGVKEAENIKTIEEAKKGNFGIRSTLSVAAAWSPNPNNPPFYVDLPTKDGVVQPMVIAQWAANSPLATIHQYISNIKRYKAIAIDIGTEDGGLSDSTQLHQILTNYGIEHFFETYSGNHTNKVAERYETKVLPFFAKELSFVAPKR